MLRIVFSVLEEVCGASYMLWYGGNKMDFQLADFGSVFSTRLRGRDVREELEKRLTPGDSVAISFESVVKVSQSFSDEFLGALLSDLGPERVHVEGEMAPAVERVLTRALRRRGFANVDGFAVAA